MNEEYYIDKDGIEIKKIGKHKYRKLSCIECKDIRWVRTDINPSRCHQCNVRFTKWKKIDSKIDNRLYCIYYNMKTRCYNKNHNHYYLYGGRGITICKDWIDSFESFRDWSLKNGYKEDLEIDRVNNNGPYSPENCRWTTHKINSRNKGNMNLLSAFGELKCLSEWLEDSRCVVDGGALYHRIKNLGWDAEKAMTEKSNRRIRYIEIFNEIKSMSEWTKDPRCVVNYSTFSSRIQNEWDPKTALTKPNRKKSI